MILRTNDKQASYLMNPETIKHIEQLRVNRPDLADYIEQRLVTHDPVWTLIANGYGLSNGAAG